jgi:hypothetical protein
MTAFTVLSGMFETYHASIEFRSGRAGGVARVLTSWHASESSKHSQLRFEDGTVLEMDHSDMAAWVMPIGDAPAGVGAPQGMSRLLAHYSRMFGDVFAKGHQPARDRDERLHRLLLMGVVARDA